MSLTELVEQLTVIVRNDLGELCDLEEDAVCRMEDIIEGLPCGA